MTAETKAKAWDDVRLGNLRHQLRAEGRDLLARLRRGDISPDNARLQAYATLEEVKAGTYGQVEVPC
jgi:hypothetical protein